MGGTQARGTVTRETARELTGNQTVIFPERNYFHFKKQDISSEDNMLHLSLKTLTLAANLITDNNFV